MKILLSAYGCHPARGSEAGIGWNWLKEIAKYNKVFVLIYAGQGQKEAVEQAVKLLEYKNNIHIVPISVPAFFQKRFYRLRYEIWQLKAYFAAKEIVKKENIDLIHQVTIAAWWFTGYYYKLNKPLLWGPISGAQQIPFKCLGFIRPMDRLYELTRTILVKILMNFSYSFKRQLRCSTKIFASNEITYNILSNLSSRSDLILLTDTGAAQSIRVSTYDSNQRTDILNLLWAGLLIPRKNFGLLLESLLIIPESINWELKVAGDGKLFHYWKAKVEKTKIASRIHFLGKVPFQEMQNLYRWADVFVFPSLREASGSVILEAMSFGVPVIALELDGAKIIMNKNCGILVPVKNKTQMINDFANAIIKLHENPQMRLEMGNNARKRVEENFLWEKRGEYMNEIYKQVISGNP